MSYQRNVGNLICTFSMIASFTTANTSIAGGNYQFTVSCSNKHLVAEWNTGDIDPGKEYLRVATGQKFPNCSISDYNASIDSQLSRERFSHEGGVVAGVPVIGPIICGVFGC